MYWDLKLGSVRMFRRKMIQNPVSGLLKALQQVLSLLSLENKVVSDLPPLILRSVL